MKIFDSPLPYEIDYLKNTVDEIGRYNESYIFRVKLELVKLGYNGPLTGEIIRFPYADGYATYMCADYPRKFSLVHLPIGDAWNSPLAELQTKQTITSMIKSDKRAKAWRAKRYPRKNVDNQ